MHGFSDKMFVFDSYDFNAKTGVIILCYLVDDVPCTERIVIPG